MKITGKRLFISFLIAVLMMIPLIAAFLYFSVDDRVKIKSTPPVFVNTSNIMRLDSTVLTPDAVTAFVNSRMQKAGVSGMAISIINNHSLVYQQYSGMKDTRKNEPFTPGTIFDAASFSKTIFADVVLQLAAENVIHLDTPLYKYLEEPLHSFKTNTFQQLLGANFIDYTDLEGDERYKQITPRMCLSHTTGFPNWRWLEDDDRLRIKFDPGSHYAYSGEGIFLLQLILEEVTGRDFEEIAVEKVFSPLNMDRTSYVWQRAYEGHHARGHSIDGNDLGIPKRNLPSASGSMSTTLEDYTIFFMNVLSQKERRHRDLLTPQIRITSKQQFGPNATVDTNEHDKIRLSYGLGFGLYETPYGKAFFKEGHDDGWQHYAVGFPEKGAGLILMSNSDNAESIFKYLIEYCLGNPYTPWYWEGYFPYDSSTYVHTR